MLISWFSLAYGSSKAIYSERLSPYGDPDPFFKYTLPVVIIQIPITLISVTTWSLVLVHARGVTRVLVLLTIVTKFLLYRGLKVESNFLALSNPAHLAPNTVERPATGFSATALMWKSIFTSTLTPCVAGHHKSWMLLLSHIFNMACLIIWMSSICLFYEMTSPLTIENNPPITYCFQGRNDSQAGYVCLWPAEQLCSQTLFRICDEQSCQVSVIHCRVNESGMTFLKHSIMPFLFFALVLSMALAFLLHWLVSYANVYYLYRSCRHGKVIHRSLLCGNAAENNHKILDEIIEMSDNKAHQLRTVVSRSNAEGDTPLHIACQNGHPSFAIKLCNVCDAKLYKQNKQELTPLHVAVNGGYVTLARLLLLTTNDKSREAEERQSKDLALVLGGRSRIDIMDLQDDGGMTPLHLAAQEGLTNSVAMLLHLGASATITNNERRVPFMLASKYGREDCLKLLTSKGVLPCGVDKDLNTPLHFATLGGYEGCTDIILDHCDRAMIDMKNREGDTALSLAAFQAKSSKCVLLLVQKGADFQVEDGELNTPLHLAASTGHQSLIKILLDKCDSTMVDARNGDGDTALSLAIRGDSSNLNIVKLFVERGADVNSRNNAGEYIIHRAIKSYSENRENVLKFLVERPEIKLWVRDSKDRDCLSLAEGGAYTIIKNAM